MTDTCYEMSGSNQCYHIKQIKQWSTDFPQINSRFERALQIHKISIYGTQCPRIMKSKTWCNVLTEKLTEQYDEALNLGVDFCATHRQVFGKHVDNCKCKHTRSGKLY